MNLHPDISQVSEAKQSRKGFEATMLHDIERWKKRFKYAMFAIGFLILTGVMIIATMSAMIEHNRTENIRLRKLIQLIAEDPPGSGGRK
jgi:hypothetical protein